MKKLPDAELSVMFAIWNANEPLTANEILEMLDNKEWHVATLNKFLSRLIERGFIEIVKELRPKKYGYVISKAEYKKIESQSFFEKLHMNSISSLISSLYDGKLSDNDIKEIEAIITTNKEAN